MFVLASAVILPVRSMSWPALTMAGILPPPRWRKMSGGSPAFSAVCSLPSMSSFWMVCILIVTFGLSFSKAVMASFQNCWPGPVVEFCHSVISTLPSLLPLDPPPPLQPASARAPTTSAADPARILLRFHVIPVLFVEGRSFLELPVCRGPAPVRRRLCAAQFAPSGHPEQEKSYRTTNSMSNVFENVFQALCSGIMDRDRLSGCGRSSRRLRRHRLQGGQRALRRRPSHRRAGAERVVRELGYESSLIASSMRSRRTGVIGVLVADFEPFSAEILKGVGTALHDSVTTCSRTAARDGDARGMGAPLAQPRSAAPSSTARSS